MRPNSIDEIIKKGFDEAEKENDQLVNESRSRIWNAIEKPQKSSTLAWGMIAALAAAVSLFLISIFLLLELESKQKQLDALQAQIINKIGPYAHASDSLFREETPSTGLGIQTERLPEQNPKALKNQLTSSVQEHNLSELGKEKAEKGEVVSLPIIERLVVDYQPEITIPDLDIQEIKAELVWPKEVKAPSETIRKNPAKLKIKIGSGNRAHMQDHSLALNLKL